MPTRNELEEARKEAHALGVVVKELSDRFETSEEILKTLRRITQRMAVLAIVAILTAVGLGVMLWFQNYRIEVVSHSIQDCLDPNGECYKQQQKRTADVLRQIIDTNHNGIPDNTEILSRLGNR